MMTSQGHTLSKEERLCSKNDISRLLEKGKFGSFSCFRFCVLQDNGLPYGRILVSVPKKFFKRAVRRNLLKRRIRESYRLQKDILAGSPTGIDIMMVYNIREIKSFREIYEAVGALLYKVTEEKK